MHDPIRLCIGKEWHQYHSSFFLPDHVLDRKNRTKLVEIQFVRSHFKGLLPKHFSKGSIPNITRSIPTEMNDMNREEPSRYVALDLCDFFIDIEGLHFDEIEPNYSKMVSY